MLENDQFLSMAIELQCLKVVAVKRWVAIHESRFAKTRFIYEIHLNHRLESMAMPSVGEITLHLAGKLVESMDPEEVEKMADSSIFKPQFDLPMR